MYAFGARYTYNRMGDLIESLVYRMRIRLIGKLERAELQGIERLGTTEIYGRLTENMATISTAGGMIAHLLQSMVIVVAGTLYLIWHSATAFADAGTAMNGHDSDTPMEVFSAGPGDLIQLVMFVVDAARPFSTPAQVR